MKLTDTAVVLQQSRGRNLNILTKWLSPKESANATVMLPQYGDKNLIFFCLPEASRYLRLQKVQELLWFLGFEVEFKYSCKVRLTNTTVILLQIWDRNMNIRTYWGLPIKLSCRCNFDVKIWILLQIYAHQHYCCVVGCFVVEIRIVPQSEVH